MIKKKLRHSINIEYDYIIYDLYEISYDITKKIYFNIYINNSSSSVSKYLIHKITHSFDINQIKLIECLLFSNMISLHSDDEKTQLAFYCKTFQLINEVLY